MRQRGEPFFFWFSAALIVIVVAGFSTAALGRPGGVLATPIHLHVHGAIVLSWYLLLACQSRLIAAAAIEQHKRLGYLSVFLAAAIIIIGYLVVRSVLVRPDGVIAGRPAVYGAMFPVTDIVNFSIAYSLGLLSRARPRAHKRLMLIAAILMIDAAMARLVFGVGLPAPFILLAELALFAALLGYNLVTLRRPHWATLLGIVLYASAMVAKVNVESLHWWPGLLQTVFML